MKIISAAVLTSMIIATPLAVASESTWNFSTNHQYYGQNGSSQLSYGNSINYQNGDVTLSVSAWSDTLEVSGDDQIQTATVASNSWGLLNYNQNTTSTANSYYVYDSANGRYIKASDSHTIDNHDSTLYEYDFNQRRWVQVSAAGTDYANDTDFLLLQFSDAVSLSQLDLGWPSGNNSSLSIGAFSQATSSVSLNGLTWSSVVDDLVYSESFNNVGTEYSLTDNSSTIDSVYSRFWLIGAYNEVFGSLNNPDGSAFKLAKLTTHQSDGSTPPPGTPVSTPSTIGLMLLGSWLLIARRRQARNK